MKNKRPVNLNLFTIQFPIPAIASIIHRITGVILFVFLPFLLWGLALSLESQESYDQLLSVLSAPFIKFIIWGLLASFIYHLIAGVRHLFMDIGIGESLRGGRLGAQLTFILSLIAIVLVGYWLW